RRHGAQSGSSGCGAYGDDSGSRVYRDAGAVYPRYYFREGGLRFSRSDSATLHKLEFGTKGPENIRAFSFWPSGIASELSWRDGVRPTRWFAAPVGGGAGHDGR